MTLWNTETDQNALAKAVNAFTVGDDYLFDSVLLPYDIQASKVHAGALARMKLITEEERKTLHKGLSEIAELHARGAFKITQEQEDGHTAIEQYLTEKYGEVGQKIHTARSRNDQVLTAIRLWQRDQLEAIEQHVHALIERFEAFARAHAEVEMPGYTHTQRAMPTTVGAWAGAYGEMLRQCLPIVHAAQQNVDMCPLGSAAGYGTSFAYPKEKVAQRLGFKKSFAVANQVQDTRLKADLDFLYSALKIGQVLSHFASDLVLFTTREFDFFTLPEALTTGSSIMPQKKNLDPAELLRARYAVLWGHFCTVQQLGLNLCSGYHRDFQLSKKPLLEAPACILSMLEMAEILVKNIVPNTEKIAAACTDELYATKRVNQLVMQGMTFREAYQQVKKSIFGLATKEPPSQRKPDE